jgi:hypothetical protein
MPSFLEVLRKWGLAPATPLHNIEHLTIQPDAQGRRPFRPRFEASSCVSVQDALSVDNAIRVNSIYGNSGLGVLF